MNTEKHFLESSLRRMETSRVTILHCLDQLDHQQIWWRPFEEQNSVGNLILHLCGNIRQWIISGVGRLEDKRNRPAEFAERTELTKAELIRRFEETLKEARVTLEKTAPDSLTDSLKVQGFDETVLSTIYECLAHLQGHTQEIIYITRLKLGNNYRYFWKPENPAQGA